MRCAVVTHVAHLLASSSWSAHEHKLPSSCSAHAVYSSYVVLSEANTVALPVGTTTSDKGNKHAQLAGAPTGCSSLTSFVHGLQRVCKGGQILVACIIPTSSPCHPATNANANTNTWHIEQQLWVRTVA